MATAGLRLDDALRGYLTEQGSKRIEKEQLWRLVGASLRLRLTANALAGYPPAVADVEPAREVLDQQAQRLALWYERLAAQVGRPRATATGPLETPEFGNAGSADGVEQSAGWHHSCWTIWVHEHLHHLAEHQSDLVGPATHVAAIRRRPWWR